MMIENLENRVLLAANVAGGTLFITNALVPINNGSVLMSVSQVGPNYRVTTSTDGLDAFFSASTIQRISIIDTTSAASNVPDQVTVDQNVVIPVSIDVGVGNDQVAGGGGPTTVILGPATIGNGQSDNDFFTQNGGGAASVLGGAGTDMITGNSGNDTLDGGADSDTIDGGAGNDSILGGAGGDSLLGSDNSDTVIGGAGADSMDGGNGKDVLDYEDHTAAVKVTFDTTLGPPLVGSGSTTNNVFTVTENDTFLVGSFEVVWGGSGNDSLDGSASTLALELDGFEGNDILTGSDAFDSSLLTSIGDTIDGGLGADLLVGGFGDDSMLGGLGNDFLTGGEGNDLLYGGTNGQDQLTPDGNDILHGDNGNDLIDGEAGNDQMNGGADNDSLLAGPDVYFVIPSLIPGVPGVTVVSGSDTFQGDTGADLIDYSARSKGVRVTIDSVIDDGDPTASFGLGEHDFVARPGGSLKILGGNGNDTMSGSDLSGGVWFVGNGGNDSMVGGFNDDTFEGGAGNDTMDGGLGSDSMIGGASNDTVTYATRGSAVFVTVDSGANDDGVAGEADDVLDVETVIGGTGNDCLTGGTGNDCLIGGLGDDSLSGSGGNDTLVGGNSTLTGNTGADTFDGGNGTDVVNFSFITAPLVITFDNQSNDGINGGTQHANVMDTNEVILLGRASNTIVGTSGADCLVGGAGNDCLVGGGGNDTLVGMGGADVLDGGDGNDCLLGNDGQDILRGGNDNDSLQGGAGSDQMRGGSGIDFVSYTYERRSVRVTQDGVANDGTTGENDLINVDVENIEGGRGNDVLIGSAASTRITGRAGNDIIKGGGGDDSLDGEAGNDTLDGGTGNDLLIGGAGSDRFIGGKNRDTVDYSDRTVALFLSMDNKVNDGAKNEFDNISATDVEIIIGGSGNDSIVGSQYNNTLLGNDGNDSLFGMAGADVLDAGDGDDLLWSNNSAGTNDLVTDVLDGGNGTDSFLSDGSENTLDIP